LIITEIIVIIKYLWWLSDQSILNFCSRCWHPSWKSF